MSIHKNSSQSTSRGEIPSAEHGQIAATAGQPSKSHRQEPGERRGAEGTSLSASASALVAAREAVRNAPDVREQLVSEIKRQISDGTYAISTTLLARAMIHATV